MRAKLIPAPIFLWLALTVLVLAGAALDAQAADLKLQAHLVWGTDDPKPPEGKDYKPVGEQMTKKLHELPLKWKNYFEVNRTNFVVRPAATRQVAVSQKCELVVKNIDSSSVEVSLIGKGKEVVKRTQALPKGELLVLGGNAPNATAWLVVLERLE